MLQKFNVFLSLLVCLLLASLIVVILVSDGRIGAEVEERTEEAPRILTVASAIAEPSDTYTVKRAYTGVTRAKKAVDLGFSRAGRIEEMLVDKGEKVVKGDPLAELEKDRLEQQRNQLESIVSSGAEGATQADVDRVKAELEDSVLTAPFDGAILEKRMTVGSMASPGAPVFRIAQEDDLEAWIAVPLDVAEKISTEKTHSLKIGGKTSQAEVETVLSEVDLTTRTRTVVFELDEETSEAHLPGESVSMEIERQVKSEPAGFWLPLTALTRETRGLWSVYGIERAEGELPKVARNFVEVIHADGDRAWVRGTPAGRFEYIPSGISRVVPGQTVKVEGDPEPTEEKREPAEDREAEKEDTP